MSPTVRDGIIFSALGALALAWCSANPSSQKSERETLAVASESPQQVGEDVSPSEMEIVQPIDHSEAAPDESMLSTDEPDIPVQPASEPVEPEIVFKPGTGEDGAIISDE